MGSRLQRVTGRRILQMHLDRSALSCLLLLDVFALLLCTGGPASSPFRFLILLSLFFCAIAPSIPADMLTRNGVHEACCGRQIGQPVGSGGQGFVQGVWIGCNLHSHSQHNTESGPDMYSMCIPDLQSRLDALQPLTQWLQGCSWWPRRVGKGLAAEKPLFTASNKSQANPREQQSC